jgi:pyruvate/2-oxoglutarate dehydrogenase complex dihydrolipoamide dehydrogenase (E3) component
VRCFDLAVIGSGSGNMAIPDHIDGLSVALAEFDSFGGTDLLLGAHILGPQASLLIVPLVQAVSHGQRVTDLARGQYWVHPALSEVVENALLKLPIDLEVLSGQAH